MAIKGWTPGLRKVSLSTLIQKHTGMGLAAAKRCTDDVLEGRLVLLPLPSKGDAAALCEALISIGAQAEIQDAG